MSYDGDLRRLPHRAALLVDSRSFLPLPLLEGARLQPGRSPPFTGGALALRKLALVGDHPLNFGQIRLVHHRIGIEMAFALGFLRSQDVALKSVSTLELTRTCLLEALRRSTVCL